MDDIELQRQEFMVPGVSGLTNIGNTCYMDAALQCLSATDWLTEYLIGPEGNGKNAEYKQALKQNCANTIMKEEKLTDANEIEIKKLRKEFKSTLTYNLRGLFAVMYGENCRITPRTFKEALGWHNRIFKGYMQHDSQECLNFIIDKIHEETKTDYNFQFPNLPEEHLRYIKEYEIYVKCMSDKNFPEFSKRGYYLSYMDYRKNNLQIDAIVQSLFYRKEYLKNNHSAITNIFTGLYIHQIKCDGCGNITFSFEPYSVLSLPITNANTKEITMDNPNVMRANTIQEHMMRVHAMRTNMMHRMNEMNRINAEPKSLISCLDSFLSKEDKLTGDDQYVCDYCNAKCDAVKTSQFWSTPPRLIIQLKRFANSCMKIGTHIQFPIHNLDMGKYMSVYVSGRPVYDLYGVIMHMGSLNGGHYTAYTKNPCNNLWYYYDDARVVQIPDEEIEERINNNNAYVLFYKKR